MAGSEKMDSEQRDLVRESTLEPGEGEEIEPTEIVLGLRHLILVVALFGAVMFMAGFVWRTLSDTAAFSELEAVLLAEPRQANPTGNQATAVPTAPSVRQAAPQVESRQMALPPVRKGFEPQPETSSVKGDPGAPVTIVEYSDYQ